MSLSSSLKKFLLKNGADEVGFGEISEFTPIKGLNSGIVFYKAYPKDIILSIKNHPTQEYLEEYINLNNSLDEIGLKCEKWLKKKGFNAYAQTTKRLGDDFGEDNSFELPHKTVATRAGLGWIGKSALFTTIKYGSAIRLSSVLSDVPLNYGTIVNNSKCGKCTLCRDACPSDAISGQEWNSKRKRNVFYDDKKCEDYAREISIREFGENFLICGKCIYACPHTQLYISK